VRLLESSGVVENIVGRIRKKIEVEN
jgi:hypothetical protein